MQSYASLIADLNIIVGSHDHAAVATVEEARAHWASIDAAHTKNLLLKDEGKRFWLVVMPADMPLDLKALPAAIGSKRLRFAGPDDLQRLLGVTSGAVSALALVNDHDATVSLVIERGLLAAPLIAQHPLRNDATVTLPPADLVRYVEATGHHAQPFDAPA